MRKNIARQDAITNQYSQGKLTNHAAAELKKDQFIAGLVAKTEQRKDLKVSNSIQTESFKRQSDNNALKQDLMDQIKQRHMQNQMDKQNKMEQERLEVERDNKMRQEHAIMQAQKRRLQHGSIGSYNKAKSIEQKNAMAAARLEEIRHSPSPPQVGVSELKNMPVSQPF